MPDRVAVILSMLQKTPDDVFLHYSLGMEYASVGRHDEAAAEFRRCIDLDKNYLPAYTEAGKSLRAAGKLQEARRLFQAGMELAAAQGQQHARDYLQQQIEGLPTAD